MDTEKEVYEKAYEVLCQRARKTLEAFDKRWVFEKFTVTEFHRCSCEHVLAIECSKSESVMHWTVDMMSKDKRAYSYLPQTMEAVPQGKDMQAIMEKAGFHNVRFKPFTFGLSTMYLADKR